VLIRPFGYFNPRRPDIVASAFSRQIALIECQYEPAVLKHGNLKSERTFLDVRDAMAAFWLLAEQGETGEAYNVGGTETLAISEVLERLTQLSTVPFSAEVDPSLLRPVDIVMQQPDIRKMQALTGWEPTITADEGLEYGLNYWRGRVRERVGA
jgi:nucleoside-diphosphate-sugar epimerase